MAVSEKENSLGFIDKRRVAGQTTTNMTEGGSGFGNFASVGQLRATLFGANAAYYTTARLDQMSKNDMVYAVRLVHQAAGI